LKNIYIKDFFEKAAAMRLTDTAALHALDAIEAAGTV
jgi:hypothetical protein